MRARMLIEHLCITGTPARSACRCMHAPPISKRVLLRPSPHMERACCAVGKHSACMTKAVPRHMHTPSQPWTGPMGAWRALHAHPNSMLSHYCATHHTWHGETAWVAWAMLAWLKQYLSKLTITTQTRRYLWRILIAAPKYSQNALSAP